MFNNIILVGNLGAAPELRYTQNGTPVLNMNVCSSESWLKDDEWQRKDEWHRIVMFGKSAEHYAKKLGKGDLVLCQGAVRTRQWDDKDGNKRYTTEIVTRKVIRFIDRKNVSEVPAQEEPPAPEPTMGDDVPF